MKKKNQEESNVSFNDALSTFYLRVYSGEHMVMDQLDSQRGNLLPLLFSINNKGSFICTIPQTGQLITWPFLYQPWCTGEKEK